MLGLILPQLVAKTAGEMALRWPHLGFSSHFLQPIYLSLQKTSASPLSLSIYLSLEIPSAFKVPALSPGGEEKNAIQAANLGMLEPSSASNLIEGGRHIRKWCGLSRCEQAELSHLQSTSGPEH